MQQFTAYIDEAGDEGLGKLAVGSTGGQSRWLILGACIVSHENDLKLPRWRDSILERFPRRQSRDLHFRNLNHERKTVVCQEIARLPLGVAVALSHKVKIPGSRHEHIFKQKGYLNNHLVRWLLERVTSACRQQAHPEPCKLKLVFSRRGSTDYHAMVEYFRLLRDGGESIPPTRRIDWSMVDFDRIAVETHSKWAGLQIADCTTSAFFSAVEPNYFGNYEQSYARILTPRLIRLNGSYLNAGITAVPSPAAAALDERQREFFNSYL